MILLDVEANGLYPTKIHCMSWVEVAGDRVIRSTTDYNVMRRLLLSGKAIIGHNIINWDIPQLERLLGIKVPGRLLDTLAISYYLYPERPKMKPKRLHGLNSWGETFGIKKPEIEDWDNLPVEVYINRCEEDVKINLKLWDRSWKILLELYGNEALALRLYGYLGFKLSMLKKAEENPLMLDNVRLMKAKTLLDQKISLSLRELETIMPQVPVYVVKKRPAKITKADGSISALGERWILFCQTYKLDPTAEEYKEVKSYDPPNAGSSAQVKDWLFSLGWEPETFEYRVNTAGIENKIPQVKKKDKSLCPSVIKLMKDHPFIAHLEDLSVLQHRRSILDRFLLDQKNGTLTAKSNGFTNTLRLMHRELVNLPGVEKLEELDFFSNMKDGVHIRGCLRAKSGYELCGSDMSALETMTKLHYMYPYDPEYVETQLTPDYDPHLDLAEFAGALTHEQVILHKEKKADFGQIRHEYKQANYSCTYMVGPSKMSRTLGVSFNHAKSIIKAFWDKNWAIKTFASSVVIKDVGKKKWAFNPVSHFWHILRNEKDVFSTINQSTGVFCFDTWMKKTIELGLDTLSGQFHDEQLFQIPLGTREDADKKLREAIRLTNEELKLNVELKVDTHFGPTYAHVH
jgi:hypothetical protein